MVSGGMSHVEALDDLLTLDVSAIGKTSELLSSGGQTACGCSKGVVIIEPRSRQGISGGETILCLRYIPHGQKESPIYIYIYPREGITGVYLENCSHRKGFVEGPPGYQHVSLKTTELCDVVRELRNV